MTEGETGMTERTDSGREETKRRGAMNRITEGANDRGGANSHEVRAPLAEQLAAYVRRRACRLHVPGHKGRTVAWGEAADAFGPMMEWDVTEIAGMDDLHQPEGIIAEAQRLAAETFGADETFFLVGGSTAGNLAMILALCGPDDLLIVQRNAHQSVLHGLQLAGASAVFLAPRVCPDSGLAAGVRPEDIALALERYPEAKGVLLTNPNYYGVGIDLRAAAAAAHAAGKPLLVDEAHGAHYGFHPDVPPSALACGADAVVQSTHKMLPAMTMGAMLHVRGDWMPRDDVRRALRMIQSSSPSYPIMASLDLARCWLARHGPEAFESGLAAARWFRDGLGRLPRFRESAASGRGGAFETKDPFKAAIADAAGLLDGFRLQRELERRGCFPELADPRHTLLVFSPASRLEDADRVLAALADIDRELPVPDMAAAGFAQGAAMAARVAAADIGGYAGSRLAVSEPVKLRSWRIAGTVVERVSLAAAAGRVAGEPVVPYPPGIPLLLPGETITEDAVRELLRLRELGCRFQGTGDPKLATVAVVSER